MESELSMSRPHFFNVNVSEDSRFDFSEMCYLAAVLRFAHAGVIRIPHVCQVTHDTLNST